MKEVTDIVADMCGSLQNMAQSPYNVTEVARPPSLFPEKIIASSLYEQIISKGYVIAKITGAKRAERLWNELKGYPPMSQIPNYRQLRNGRDKLLLVTESVATLENLIRFQSLDEVICLPSGRRVKVLEIISLLGEINLDLLNFALETLGKMETEDNFDYGKTIKNPEQLQELKNLAQIEEFERENGDLT